MEDVPEEDRAVEELDNLWQNLHLHDGAELPVDLWDYVGVDNDVAIEKLRLSIWIAHRNRMAKCDLFFRAFVLFLKLLFL